MLLFLYIQQQNLFCWVLSQDTYNQKRKTVCTVCKELLV